MAEDRGQRIKMVIASRKKAKRWRNDPQISQIDADEGKGDFVWKGWTNRMTDY